MSLSPAFCRACFRRLILIGLAVGGLFAAGALADAEVNREARIKAALVFKLVKFVRWPASAMSGKEAIRFCAFGDSAIGDLLAAVEGKPVRDRLAQFRLLKGLAVADIKDCHVLYVGAGAQEVSGSASPAWRTYPVLTISDAPDFSRGGGMIGLTSNQNKLSFEINLRVARESGLELDAPLLDLATVIE